MFLLTACIPAFGGDPITTPGPTEAPTQEPAGNLGYGTITGTVTDSRSGAPVSGATVSCSQVSYFPQGLCDGSTTTGSDGSFRFENIFFHDTDTLTLEIQANGYSNQTVSANFFTFAGWEVNLALDPLASADFPFQRMTVTQGFPAQAHLFDVWISPDGTPWVATDAGLYIGEPVQGGNFSLAYDETLIQIIGVTQNPQTVWALGTDGTTIHAFRGDQWFVYGQAQGWEPLPDGVRSDAPAVSSDGVVWLATGADDLRRFDPAADAWSSMHAADLGFTPADPDYQGHYLTDAVVSQDGALWVSDCIGMGEGFAGQGVRYLQDGEWNSTPATDGQCVFDLARAADGRMWVGGENSIPVYDIASGSWSEVAPPTWDRQQYIVGIAFDPAGTPLIESMQCGGASCDGISVFIREANAWLPVLNEAGFYWPGPKHAFDPDGSLWTCWQGSIYHQVGSVSTLVGKLRASTCEVAVSESGVVWAAVYDGKDAGLWQVVR